MNAGGDAVEPLFASSPGGEAPEITYGEAFTVQPFGNTLVVKTCAGQQLYDVLVQQFNNPAAGSSIMLPSANVDYHWTTVGGPHVVDGTLSFDNGTFVDKAASYRVALNNFTADGGDNFTVFRSLHQRARGRGRHRRVRSIPRPAQAARPAGLDRIHKDG